MKGGRGAELGRRIAVALVGIPVALALGYLGGYLLAGFLALLAALAAREFYDMNRRRGVASFRITGTALAAALVLLATLGGEPFVVGVTVAGLLIGTPAVLRAAGDDQPALAASVTAFGAFYAGGLLAFAFWLRMAGAWGPDVRGAAVLFLPIVVTWLGDTAAYTAGRAVGRHPLAPSISPGKTREGAIAGLLVAVGSAVAYVELTRPIVEWTMPMTAAAVLGLVVGIAGQAGDLVESRFKRDCGVKDSSGLLPGHGGVLDRLDSLLFAFPAAYAYLRMVGI